MNAILELKPYQMKTGEKVFPAVPGEFYAYTSRFTQERPVYTMLKCKSNKDWPLAAVAELGAECNFVFMFSSLIRVNSIKIALDAGMLDSSVGGGTFDESWIASTSITPSTFYDIRSQKDATALMTTCRDACMEQEKTVELKSGVVYAMQTGAGKYGMFLMTYSSPSSLEIDACHILF